MGSLSYYQWSVIFVIFFTIYLVARISASRKGRASKTGVCICRNCGTRGYPDVHTKGSIFIEIILWIFLLVPGLVYSIWRLTTRDTVCPECRRNTMISVRTPIGATMSRRYENNTFDGKRVDHHI